MRHYCFDNHLWNRVPILMINCFALILFFLSYSIHPTNAATKHQERNERQEHDGIIDQSVRDLYGESFGNDYCKDHPTSSLGIWAISSEKSSLDASATKRINEELYQVYLNTDLNVLA